MEKVLFSILLFLFIPANLYAAGCWNGIAEGVIDGRTLSVSRRNIEVTVRLYGIAAPGKNQPLASEAKTFLQDLVLKKAITVCPKKTPGGMAAEVHVLKGYMQNVNHLLLRKGLAKSTIDHYAKHEQHAQTRNLGLWSPENLVQAGPKQSSSPAALQQNPAGRTAAGGLTVYKADASNSSDSPLSAEEAMRQAASSMERQEQLDAARQRDLFQKDYEPELTDVDSVEINALFDYGTRDTNGLIEISLYYASTNLDRDVYWEGGDVSSECRVTGHFSNGTNTRIAKSNDVLNSHQERIYIDVPSYFLDQDNFVILRSCTVECRVSAGIFDLKASDKFEVYFRGIPDRKDPR